MIEINILLGKDVNINFFATDYRKKKLKKDDASLFSDRS